MPVTDGFFEWANSAEELLGNERLQHSVRGTRDKSAAEIISILYKDVIQFAGGTSQKDDLTAIVIKRIQADHRRAGINKGHDRDGKLFSNHNAKAISCPPEVNARGLHPQ